ncbi:hypothetical protein GPEL0_01f2671 [Geoanaerobacter pelophilus]|uniref:Uncharacterized protein n=1 Tax=Geoanaerobacter pelophilus TaxID=60036 RepID=A0ABQ0MIX5_9BACT|nr:hypothetical protein GPEL0_01f2671 [Geoanaerobacter pelophilus]
MGYYVPPFAKGGQGGFALLEPQSAKGGRTGGFDFTMPGAA